jgi:hypothetical protein
MRTTLNMGFPLIVNVATVSLLFAANQVQTESAFSATISPTGQIFSARACRKASSPVRSRTGQ